jgi:hypothetical protein
MHIRAFALVVATAVGILGFQTAASSSPVTKQSFTLTADINDEGGGTVVASGAINATGEDVVVSDTEDQFVFPAGTLTIIHAPVRNTEHFNTKKCTGSFHEQGTYVISAGTGAYHGVTGSGAYRVTARFDSDCTDTPPVGTVVITAHGTINLPAA